jgi:hypothetical protein
MSEPDAVAIEQCLWWVSHGFSPVAAMAALGVVCLRNNVDWHDVAFAASIAWVRATNG